MSFKGKWGGPLEPPIRAGDGGMAVSVVVILYYWLYI